MTERGVSSDRRDVLIEIGIGIGIGIGIEIEAIGETFDNDPDPDPDLDRAWPRRPWRLGRRGRDPGSRCGPDCQRAIRPR
jgi:hypothetical protein